MMDMKTIFAGLLVMVSASNAVSQELNSFLLIDLSHSYDQNTLYWPTSTSKFEKHQLDYGVTKKGYFYSSFSVCTPEHGGTHLDAPMHFAREGLSTDQLPLEQLIAPGVVIDVSTQAAKDRNYRLSVADIQAHEQRHGNIMAGSIVMLKTNWSRYWPDAKAYLGDDTPNDASNLSFPGYGVDAAKLLVEARQVALLGIDTASIDYGASEDFMVHRISASNNVGGLENLTGLDQLPATGFLLVALPMKIAGGSGAPVRVVALIPPPNN